MITNLQITEDVYFKVDSKDFKDISLFGNFGIGNFLMILEYQNVIGGGLDQSIIRKYILKTKSLINHTRDLSYGGVSATPFLVPLS